MGERGWYSSGKERKPGNLLKYTLVVLTGVVFAVTAIVMMLVTAKAERELTGVATPDIWQSLLWALIAGAISAVVGIIIWYLSKALTKKQ